MTSWRRAPPKTTILKMLNGLVVHFHVKPDILALFYPLLTTVFYITIYPRFISTISVGEYGRLCIQTSVIKCVIVLLVVPFPDALSKLVMNI